MPFVLALACAAVYGAADFLGGLASRRAGAIAIVVVSQFAGLIALLAILPFLPVSSPSATDWMWGALAGVAGGTGVGAAVSRAGDHLDGHRRADHGCLRGDRSSCRVDRARRTARGRHRSRVSRWHSRQSSSSASRRRGARLTAVQGSSPVARGGIATALASGVAIGLFFLVVARLRPEAGLWPLVAARGVSVGLFATLAVVTGRSLRMPAR